MSAVLCVCTTSMRRECDRLSKARHRALVLKPCMLRKEHDRASKAKKRVLEPDSEGCTLCIRSMSLCLHLAYNICYAIDYLWLCLHYNEQERHCKRGPRDGTRFYRLWTRYYGHNFVNVGEGCTLVLFFGGGPHSSLWLSDQAFCCLALHFSQIKNKKLIKK